MLLSMKSWRGSSGVSHESGRHGALALVRLMLDRDDAIGGFEEARDGIIVVAAAMHIVRRRHRPAVSESAPRSSRATAREKRRGDGDRNPDPATAW